MSYNALRVRWSGKYETGWVPYFLIALLLLVLYPNFYLFLVVPIDIRADSPLRVFQNLRHPAGPT